MPQSKINSHTKRLPGSGGLFLPVPPASLPHKMLELRLHDLVGQFRGCRVLQKNVDGSGKDRKNAGLLALLAGTVISSSMPAPSASGPGFKWWARPYWLMPPVIESTISERKPAVRIEPDGKAGSKCLTVLATAYCGCKQCCGIRANGYTSTGMWARYGVVAVDPRVIPLNSRLYIPGYGYAVAADTGSAIKGMRIDLFFPSHEKARAYGKRRVDVYILEEEQ